MNVTTKLNFKTSLALLLSPMTMLSQSSTLPANAPARERSIAPGSGRTYNSHQVNSDRSITFRLDAPNAHRVELVTDITRDVLPLAKGEDGLWSVTTSPLPPAIYAYAFSVDGVDQPDPKNPWLKANLVSNASMVLVPDAQAKPWEPTDVPHGTVHSHLYTSRVIEGMPAKQNRYLVYTPPAYDTNATTKYPVLYLLHGWSDSEISWTQIGQANLIMDSLIGARKIEPMVVVMPLSYGEMEFVEKGINVWNDSTAILANLMHFQQALLNEILPQVESTYHVRNDRDGRALAGQSMGGLESLVIGFNHPDTFGWIGGFSSAVTVLNTKEGSTLLSNTGPGTAQPRLLWISCGTDDPLLSDNRAVTKMLTERTLSVTSIETPGGHTWPVWRDDLIRFTPLLFRNAQRS